MQSPNRKGQPRGALDQGARKVGQDDGKDTNTKSEHSIPPCDSATHGILDDLADAPLILLAALLLSDASHEEIVRRLRLNVAIRMLCEAIAEADCAGGQW
jgi:hypothetical protein